MSGKPDMHKKVSYSHRCPICQNSTQEEYEEHWTWLETYSRYSVSEAFKEEKEGRKPFDRFKCGDRVLLACPNCGAVLSADVCESKSSNDDSKPLSTRGFLRPLTDCRILAAEAMKREEAMSESRATVTKESFGE